MIRVYLSLFSMGLAGVGLLVAPPSLFNFGGGDPATAFKILRTSLEVFAIPLSLCLLAFTKHPFVRMGAFAWGCWMTLFSLFVLFFKGSQIPGATFYGLIFVIFLVVISITAVVSGAIFLFGSKIDSTESPKTGTPSRSPAHSNKPL